MSKFFKTKASIKIEKMEIKDICSLCQEDFGSEVQVQHYCKLSGNYSGNGLYRCINKVESKKTILYMFYFTIEKGMIVIFL